MDEKTKKLGKSFFGWSDEEIEGLSPEMVKFISSEAYPDAFLKYKMVAEVTESSNCAARLKKGDRLVFTSSGTLLPDECTVILCLWAIAPLLPFSYMVWDHIYHGTDPCSLFPDTVKCADTGVRCGGFGEVAFKVFCIESPWTPRDATRE